MSPAFGKSFALEILTPDGSICREDVSSVQFPARDGQVGILPDRAPLIAIIGAGRLSAAPVSGEKRTFFVSGGFVQVRETGTAILAEECTPVEKLDAEQLWAQLQEVRKLPADTDEQYAYRSELIAEAQMRFKLAMKRTPGGLRRAHAEEFAPSHTEDSD